MRAADILLDHYDRLTGSSATYRNVAPDDAVDDMIVAIYRGYPVEGAVTGFTIGLSHLHLPGGQHNELTVSMRDVDDVWVHAMGVVAYRLRNECLFQPGDTIDFGAPIRTGSALRAFVVAPPMHFGPQGAVIDLGIRRVNLVALVPIHAQERQWLAADGTLDALLDGRPRELLLNPTRGPLLR